MIGYAVFFTESDRDRPTPKLEPVPHGIISPDNYTFSPSFAFQVWSLALSFYGSLFLRPLTLININFC
jgi:hypothetical protein